MGGKEYEAAKTTVQKDSYVDDIIASFVTVEESCKITSQIESLLAMGGL